MEPLFAASSTTLLLTGSFLGILVAFAGFFTLAEMVLDVAGNALAADLAPVKPRGTYLALFGACFSLSYGLSPIAAGYAAIGLISLAILNSRRREVSAHGSL